MAVVLEINSVNHGSTGTIMRNIAIEAESSGLTVYTSCQKARSTEGEKYGRHLYIGNRIDRNLHLRLGNLTGRYGLFSKRETKKFLREVDRIKPDIIHLHNLHKGYINFELLFSHIKENNIPTVWTLHDFWSFTGECPYFDRAKCDRWKHGCGHCPSYKEYPSMVDSTQAMYRKKKAAFTGVSDLTIVTPSKWLAGLVASSFLNEYPVRVINNGIDLSIFKPTQSNIREEYRLEGKIIILGVASIWDSRKRLDVFEKLSHELDDRFQIILIGLSKEQKDSLPPKIIGLERTENAQRLAAFYSAADVFLNPTVEDNFPTVNIEALACGTPVMTFATGGSVECIEPGCGTVVNEENLLSCLERIQQLGFDRNKCVSAGRNYSASAKYQEYVQLYREISERK